MEFNNPRRFIVLRKEDVSGVSGTGHVADGVVFWDGTTVMYWRHKPSSLVVFKDLDSLLSIHGHEGKTTVRWIDD